MNENISRVPLPIKEAFPVETKVRRGEYCRRKGSMVEGTVEKREYGRVEGSTVK